MSSYIKAAADLVAGDVLADGHVVEGHRHYNADGMVAVPFTDGTARAYRHYEAIELSEAGK